MFQVRRTACNGARYRSPLLFETNVVDFRPKAVPLPTNLQPVFLIIVHHRVRAVRGHLDQVFLVQPSVHRPVELDPVGENSRRVVVGDDQAHVPRVSPLPIHRLALVHGLHNGVKLGLFGEGRERGPDPDAPVLGYGLGHKVRGRQGVGPLAGLHHEPFFGAVEAYQA